MWSKLTIKVADLFLSDQSSTKWKVALSACADVHLILKRYTVQIVTTSGNMGFWKIKASGWSKVTSFKCHGGLQYRLETSALVITYTPHP